MIPLTEAARLAGKSRSHAARKLSRLVKAGQYTQVHRFPGVTLVGEDFTALLMRDDRRKD